VEISRDSIGKVERHGHEKGSPGDDRLVTRVSPQPPFRISPLQHDVKIFQPSCPPELSSVKMISVNQIGVHGIRRAQE
jgi:hypothetical protein